MVQRDFILLDRSGSMKIRWEEAVSSINAYVQTLKDEEVETGVTVITFDTQLGDLSFDVIRHSAYPENCAPISPTEITPRGGTPLNDAIKQLVQLTSEGTYEKVALIIMTDGEERDSRHTSHQEAKTLLDECRAKGWQVIFLGADFDTTQQAARYGTANAQTMSVGASFLGGVMRETGRMRALYASTGKAMAYSGDVSEGVQLDKEIMDN